MIEASLQVKKLSANARLPVMGSKFAAGYDLHASGSEVVPARGKKLISTGLAFSIPHGNYGRIAPRSGLAAKNSIDVGAGVIDSDYRGEVKVLLFNLSSEADFQVNEGDRIAQLIIEKYTPTQLIEVETLSETVRGDGGFGSTGVAEKSNENSKKRNPSAQEASSANADQGEPNFLGSSSDVLLKNGDKTKGGVATTVGETISDKSGKLLMIYLSMHDCPGCREFTPLLLDLYEELNQDTKTFEVVFFSGDKQEDVFKSYYAEMPWPAIPWKDARLKRVVKHFGIRGLPRLIVMDAKTNKVLHSDAVEPLT